MATRVLAVVQARLGSTRLPGKALAEIAGRPMLAHVLARAAAVPGVDQVVLATTVKLEDDALADLARSLGIACARGSVEDVLDRFRSALLAHPAEVVLRVTGDCPLLDPWVCGLVLDEYFRSAGAVDYVSNVDPPTYPDGLDAEVFSSQALERAWREARLSSDREHVTTYIRDHRDRFRAANVANGEDLSAHRWVVDTAADLTLVHQVYASLDPAGTRIFGMAEVLELLARRPELRSLNAGIRRNEGLERSRVQSDDARRFDRSMEYLARARRVVPGASQTLSKAPSMFVEGAYPVFLERGYGCHVWDVDGNEYVDYVLGLASVTLGYAYPAVGEAVARQLERGSIFSLPHPLEVEVSERLTRLIPCAEMARFLKTGSEANSAAVRVARAATGRDVIAFCGYSGWHDWYAVTTPRSKGIPKDFARLVVPFTYNDLHSLETALDEHRGHVAAVIMEPVLLDAPTPGFLAGVKAAAHRHGALLIFDEIVSGFRWAVGGAQEYFGVVPDLAVFGKGMANGLPLAAVVGRRELMNEFEEIFVSSTFGGDTLALAACLATLGEYGRRQVIDHLWRIGQRFQEGFAAIAARLGLPARCVGYPVHPKIVIDHEAPETQRLLMSLFLQETARRGAIFHFAGFNVSFSHTEADVDQTLSACEATLRIVGESLADGRIRERLRGKPYQEAFRRS